MDTCYILLYAKTITYHRPMAAGQIATYCPAYVPRKPTPAEAKLWTPLRNRHFLGYRFHRQHQIDRFIVDFVCLQPKLVIEVDGAVHQQQVEADLEREQILERLGYRIIRFTNHQVLDETAEVLQKILASLP